MKSSFYTVYECQYRKFFKKIAERQRSRCILMDTMSFELVQIGKHKHSTIILVSFFRVYKYDEATERFILLDQNGTELYSVPRELNGIRYALLGVLVTPVSIIVKPCVTKYDHYIISDRTHLFTESCDSGKVSMGISCYIVPQLCCSILQDGLEFYNCIMQSALYLPFCYLCHLTDTHKRFSINKMLN